MSFNFQYGLFKFDITDHYAILGLPLDSDAKRIREKYLKIAHLLHPDTCKAPTNAAKSLANQTLAKLVNPAYKTLSRTNQHKEYDLILSQLGDRLAKQGGKITIATQAAKELLKAEHNLELIYHRQLQSLTANQYESLERLTSIISEISELNLMYLILKAGQKKKRDTAPSIKPPDDKIVTQTESAFDQYIRRAQQYIEKQNYTQARMELEDAMKLDINSSRNSTCYGWLSLIYLRQKQLSMAKFYLSKGSNANANDPVVIKAKNEYSKVASQTTSPGKTRSGILGGLFGGKNK